MVSKLNAGLCLAGFYLFVVQHGLADSEAIVAKWQARRDALSTVRIQLTGTHSRQASKPLEGASDDFMGFSMPPTPAHTSSITIDMLLDIENERYWIREQDDSFSMVQDPPAYTPYYLESAYDGTLYYRYQPDDRNLGWNNERGRTSSEYDIGVQHQDIVFKEYVSPVFPACGIVFANTPLKPNEFQLKMTAGDFVEQGAVDVQGQRCILLRGKPGQYNSHYEYLVDAMDPLKVRQINGYLSSGDNPVQWCSWEIEYQDSEFGPIPKSWEVNRTAPVVEVFHLELVSFEPNVPVEDSDFTFDPQPGTRVYDRRRPRGEEAYVIPEPGGIPLPPEEVVLQAEHTAKVRSKWLSSLVLLLVVVGGIVWWKTGRRT